MFILSKFTGSCRFCRETVLLLAAVLFSLVLAEGVLRLFELDFVPAELALYRSTPGGGFGLLADLDVDVRFGKQQLNISTNSMGQRWPEPPAVHDGQRVALVGDSFLFGLWADSVDNGMAAVFHREIGLQRFHVANYAVPGYGFADIELQLPEILDFQPHTLLLVSYNGNDLLDTWLGPARYRVSDSGVLALDYDLVERLVPMAAEQNFRFKERALQWSYLLRMSQTLWRMFRPPAKASMNHSVNEDGGYDSDQFWSRRDYPPFAVEARQASVQSLARIAAFCRQHSIQLMMVSIPYREQVYAADEYSEAYDVGLPQSVVGDFAQDQNLFWLDLQPILAEHYRQQQKPLHHLADGHFNTLGHKVAGEEMAKFFLRNQASE